MNRADLEYPEEIEGFNGPASMLMKLHGKEGVQYSEEMHWLHRMQYVRTYANGLKERSNKLMAMAVEKMLRKSAVKMPKSVPADLREQLEWRIDSSLTRLGMEQYGEVAILADQMLMRYMDWWQEHQKLLEVARGDN